MSVPRVTSSHAPAFPTSIIQASAKTDSKLEFFCGSCAAVVNISCTFPLNKVMFRQQLFGLTAVQAIQQLKQESLLNLYRGVVPILGMRVVTMSIMFGMYDKYKKILKHYYPGAPVYVYRPVAAMLAGSTEALLTPLERVQSLLQDRRYDRRFNGTLHAFKELRVYGLSEYWRGLTPILMRNGPSNVIFFVLRQPFKSMMPETSIENNPVVYYLEHFVSGAVLGASISTLFYPVNVVKTRMQSKLGGRFLTFREAFTLVFNERNRNWALMFRGVNVNFTRSLLSWGIINASYEALRKLVYGRAGEELTS